MGKLTGTLFFIFFLSFTKAQPLKPGFDKAEYIEMLRIGAQFGDSAYASATQAPSQYRFVYRSPVTGLDNCWEMWASDQVAIISIRGTTLNNISWLANFYAAMAPAKGELQLGQAGLFRYELATAPRAAVHVGWLVSMAFLSKDILPKLDSCHKKGIKQFIITGHSQGGGIAYLLTAYLYHLQKQHVIGSDIRFKTYCSAAPKPGNLYFAYEYESMTQGGWAYNVVNPADWVPQVPVSIQTLDDFNAVNPFKHFKALIKKQKFPKNLTLRHAYNRLDKPPRRARDNYRKYLGEVAAKIVKKVIKGYQPPKYFNSNDYVRTGNTIMLPVDEDYYRLYPDDSQRIFIHHLHAPYLYLAEKLP